MQDQLLLELRPVSAGNDGDFDDAEKIAQQRGHLGVDSRFAFSKCSVQVKNDQRFHSMVVPLAEAENP